MAKSVLDVLVYCHHVRLHRCGRGADICVESHPCSCPPVGHRYANNASFPEVPVACFCNEFDASDEHCTVPTLVVFGVLRYLQRENVSMALLVEMFWLGLVGAIPIAFIEAGLAWLTIRHWQDSRNLGVMFAVATLNAFIVAALIEESFKYLCITRVVANERSENCWNRHPRRAYGVVLCGCAAALGFATIENILYCWADLAVQTAVLRAILAVPGHCAGGVIIAVGVAEREYYGVDTNMFWIILPSVLFHGFYDWFLMASVIGYMDGQETGDALALAGLVCAMLTDIVQFLFMFRRLNQLEEHEKSSEPDDKKALFE